MLSDGVINLHFFGEGGGHFFVSLNFFVTGYIYIYPVTKKLSDAKVERQVYKLALFGGGGGSILCCHLTFYIYF